LEARGIIGPAGGGGRPHEVIAPEPEPQGGL